MKTVHEICKPSEVWLGNTKVATFPKPYLKDLHTLRTGSIAYDIHGQVLPSEYRPLFIDKSEFDRYNIIMMNLNKRPENEWTERQRQADEEYAYEMSNQQNQVL